MSPVTMTGARHAPNSEYYGKEPQLDSVYADHDRDDLELEHAVAYSTAHDANNMKRMGRSQVLVRHFRFLSMASFVAIATAAWEIGLFLVTPALTNGGRPALLYSILWNFIGFGPIYLSMAEMASMAPIAGAQYHWVSEFAPAKYQKLLSYATGWTSSIAWQAGNAIGVFLVGTLCQSIIQINLPVRIVNLPFYPMRLLLTNHLHRIIVSPVIDDPSSMIVTTDLHPCFPAWHATLMVIGAVIIAFCGNFFAYKLVTHAQNFIFAIHVLAYFGLIIPIWFNAPRVSSKEVWTEFENYGGWSNLGLSIMIGQLSGIYTQVGIDTAAHMSEEVRDASRTVPKAMITVWLVNFCLIFPAAVTICYHIPSVSDSLADPTLYPTIYVLRETMNGTWLSILLGVIVGLLVCSNITYLAAATRDLFAFARDNGLPFSPWMARVHSTKKIPHNAILVTSFISILLALIYLGSTVAFYAITSLLTVALLQCYCLSIGCLLWRRITHPESLPPASFSLGRAGIPINAAAVLYAFWAFFWSFWPQYSPVTPESFNWASVIFVGVLLIAAVFFVVKARKVYHGPVVLIRERAMSAGR